MERRWRPPSDAERSPTENYAFSMTDTTTANPYETTSLPNDATTFGLTRLQSALLALLAIVLLLRGGFMLFSWVMQLASGFKLDSHFYAAIITKDAIYGISACIGGALLLARHKLGWWLALVHWCWYIACEIVVVATGATLGWRIPVHHAPPTLYRVIGLVALLAICGLSVLLWRPVASSCNAAKYNRSSVLVAVMAFSVASAFAVNWWMSLR
jgi:hypothetical protein